MTDRLPRDWPHRQFSRFVETGGQRWHVQVMGEGPALLMIHGTGASTHSWRDLVPLLTPHFTLVAPDLPGHGFSPAPVTSAGYSLPRVASGLSALLHTLGLKPDVAVGHSAGAAVAIRMCLDGAIRPAAVVSLNGALLPFPGMSNEFFRPVARFVATSGITAHAFAFLAGAGPTIERMLRSTGSKLDAGGTRYYQRLASNPAHVAGALGLMANWDLQPLLRDMPRLDARLILVTGSKDGMVPPAEAFRVRALLPKAELVSLRGLGHLAHEEKPGDVAEILKKLLPRES